MTIREIYEAAEKVGALDIEVVLFVDKSIQPVRSVVRTNRFKSDDDKTYDSLVLDGNNY